MAGRLHVDEETMHTVLLIGTAAVLQFLVVLG
jgi:hypothetical protein